MFVIHHPALQLRRIIAICLEFILGLDLPDDNYEVIIVDDGSDDRGLGIVKSYQNSHSCIRLISQAYAGTSTALNSFVSLKWN